MKYFPLIWAALWRKPAHTILTLLSVTMAFTLFGVMIGFNASVNRLVNGVYPERVYVYSRFGNGPGGYSIPLAYKDQILRLPGVANIGYRSGIPGGYYQDKKNRVYVYTIDDGFCQARPEFQMTPARCRQLQASRTGVFITRLIADRNHLKPGDAFPVTTTTVTRQDGGKVWVFTVIGILDDIPRQPTGYILGNYTFQDEARPLAERGTVATYAINISASDPALAAKTALAIEALFANSGDPVHADTELSEAQEASQGSVNIPLVTMVVAGAGLFMVLFLTGNGIYQSVRERIPEFAVMKTIGFSDFTVMTLVFAETAFPCLAGAVIGLSLASAFAAKIPSLMPPTLYLPAPYLPASVLGLGLFCALSVALLSAIMPTWRLKRLDVAAALSGK